MNIVNILFIFIIFSFIGWIIELIYRSFSHKKVVNPGFLTGPYLPIYGYGSLMIYFITLYTNNLNVFWSIILYFISLGLLEFLTGYLFLKYFKIRLWDYSNDFMNIKGHICLEFMIYWTFLALFFKYYIFPKIYNILNNSFFSRTHVFFVGFVYGIFIIDNINSLEIAYKTRKFILQFNEKLKLNKKLISQRVNFERLYHDLTDKLNEKVKKNKKISNFKSKILSLSNYFRLRRDVKEEFSEVLRNKIEELKK